MNVEAIKALAKAQTEMGKALKNAANPHLKSKYADLNSVMDACFPALHGNGFAVLQPCGKDEAGPFVDTILAHTSGEMFTSRVHLVLGKQDMQGVGSAITYARRYGLLGMAGIAPEDDDGEATKAKRQEPKDEEKPAGPNPVETADNMIAHVNGATSEADLKGRISGAKFVADEKWLMESHTDQAKRVATAVVAKKVPA